jgi:hypothetical protein
VQSRTALSNGRGCSARSPRMVTSGLTWQMARTWFQFHFEPKETKVTKDSGTFGLFRKRPSALTALAIAENILNVPSMSTRQVRLFLPLRCLRWLLFKIPVPIDNMQRFEDLGSKSPGGNARSVNEKLRLAGRSGQKRVLCRAFKAPRFRLKRL